MSIAVAQVQTSDFTQQVLEHDAPVVVDFWAPWCGPCRMMAPEMEKLAARLGAHARVTKINVDENPAIAGQYGVMSIPTLIVFHKGQEIGRHVGFISADALASAIEDYLGVKAA